MKTKKIPIQAAKKLSEKYGFSEIIILAYDVKSGFQNVVTFGKTKEQCINAANNGNHLKRKFFGWPEELCNAKPRRIK